MMILMIPHLHENLLMQNDITYMIIIINFAY